MHVEQQRQLMMRERQQKQATAAALAATSLTSTTPSIADSTRTPSAASPGVPGNSQQQQGSKRQLTLTVSTLQSYASGTPFSPNTIDGQRKNTKKSIFCKIARNKYYCVKVLLNRFL